MEPTLTTTIPPRLRLLTGALIISFSPVLVLLASKGALGPTAIAFFRTAIGGVILLLMALVRRRSLRLSKGALGFCLLAGFLFFVDLFCWHRSIIYVGAGMATILGNTQVFATAVLSRIVFTEPLTIRFASWAVAAFSGLVLLVGVGSADVHFTSQYLQGIAFGLATGLTYSGYIICLKKGTSHSSRLDLVTFMAWTSAFSAVFLFFGAVLEGDLVPNDLTSVAAVFGLGLLVQAFAWLVITSVLPAIPTAQAGLILLLQPTLATVWEVLFFDKRLTVLQTIGAIITLAAMYFGGPRGLRDK